MSGPVARIRFKWIRRVLPALAASLLIGGCRGGSSYEPARLATGARLDPEGVAIPLGSMPVTMAFSPDSSRIVAVLSGYREQGFQVVDAASRRVVQTVEQPAAFLGAAFAPDGRTLYVSGGNADCVYVYAWGDTATLRDSIVFVTKRDPNGGHVYPARLACSPDGSRLYVAGNLNDSLMVIDTGSRRVVQRLPAGRYPYGVLVEPDGRVWVSLWGGHELATFVPGTRGLAPAGRVAVGRHPSAMAFDATRSRIYVTCAASDLIAVVDARADSVIATIEDSAPGAPSEGSTPNALAFSPDHHRLYVAEADNNAIAVVDLGEGAAAKATLVGRIPTPWYPTDVLARGDSLYALSGKGAGSGPNTSFRQPGRKVHINPRDYSIGQTSGSLSVIASPSASALAALSRRVADANGWVADAAPPRLPPFRHVIYVIRENRTYDQILGDLPGADGDTSLVCFPRHVTPNDHALAERFGIFDRFFTSGEVSGDGHNWTDAAYASDYLEKTLPNFYSFRGRTYDYNGTNRDDLTDDDASAGPRGFLWDAAQKKGVSLRNFGEFSYPDSAGHWHATKPWLAARTDSGYPGWDLDTRDSIRADRWIAAFGKQVAGDSVPGLTLLYLPNDHTAGARKGSPTPRAYLADNDRALGRIVEAVSHSPVWKNTVIFVLEDDAQDGPDHVDTHRSLLLVISAWNRAGVHHRFVNTVDVVTTIGAILHLDPMSKFDRYGRAITECFGSAPDTRPYVALQSNVPWAEVNSDSTVAARLSRRLDFSREDRADFATLNRILWAVIKGPNVPYPRAARWSG